MRTSQIGQTHSNNSLLLSIKLINTLLKYPHNIESSGCIPEIFVLTILLSINFLICLGICSTLKLSKYVSTSFLL